MFKPNLEMQSFIKDSTLLITGGTGTFGKAFIDLCIRDGLYRKIVIFSRDEYKQHLLQSSLTKTLGHNETYDRFRFFLGDVRDRERLRTAFKGVEHVIHAAALKHVSFCEYNPSEALLTNVDGTKNVCDVACELGVPNVVCLSTDKAVEPINFYGSTKMLGERYAVHSNVYGGMRTRVSCVRYGNIMGSRGSVVETFRDDISRKGCFDITDERMTRFWMQISSAAEMVLWTLLNARGGEVVLPRLRASRVFDVARLLDSEMPYRVVGIRPGEKLHEQLLHRREHERTFEHPDGYYVVVPDGPDWTHVHDAYSYYPMTQRVSYQSDDADIQCSEGELRTLCDIEGVECVTQS